MKRAHVFAGIVLLMVFVPCSASTKTWYQGKERSYSPLPGAISLEHLKLTEE